MKFLCSALAVCIAVFSCQQEDLQLFKQEGVVQFGDLRLEFVPMGALGSKITGISPWIHILPKSADLVFTSKETNEVFTLKYNPSDFSTPYTIRLPFGSYEYESIVECATLSEYLPFEVRGEFVLDSQRIEIRLKAETSHGLITVKNQFVEGASVMIGNNESTLVLPDGGTYWYLYVHGGKKATLEIKESFANTTITRELIVEANKHFNFVLKRAEGSAVITDLILDAFELHDEEIVIGLKPLFYEENGTIKCPNASPGDSGVVNGKSYFAVSNGDLRGLAEGFIHYGQEVDFTCLCTSLVTDMRLLFYEGFRFNQPIGNWDVSNVTNMLGMFNYAGSFNQPIGNWDVGQVTDMSYMFEIAPSFNQPIGDWNVANVTSMTGMFWLATSFNQPIGAWKVDKVRGMYRMFRGAVSFNQDISSWNVSNVGSMEEMFYNTNTFNQPIGKWKVDNVRGMREMFAHAVNFNQDISTWNVSKVEFMDYMFLGAKTFNQPIGNWKVDNVIDMEGMFYDAVNFNQNLSSWCVANLMEVPREFAFSSALVSSNMPIWGTCPD
jgi:surface protein